MSMLFHFDDIKPTAYRRAIRGRRRRHHRDDGTPFIKRSVYSKNRKQI